MSTSQASSRLRMAPSYFPAGPWSGSLNSSTSSSRDSSPSIWRLANVAKSDSIESTTSTGSGSSGNALVKSLASLSLKVPSDAGKDRNAMLAAQAREAQRKAAFNASFQLKGPPAGKTALSKATQNFTSAASAKARAVSTMIPEKAVMLAYTAVLVGSRELAIRAVYQGQEGKKVQIYLWLDPRSAVMDTIMDLDRLYPGHHFVMWIKTRRTVEHADISKAYFVGDLSWSPASNAWQVKLCNTNDPLADPSLNPAATGPEVCYIASRIDIDVSKTSKGKFKRVLWIEDRRIHRQGNQRYAHVKYLL